MSEVGGATLRVFKEPPSAERNGLNHGAQQHWGAEDTKPYTKILLRLSPPDIHPVEGVAGDLEVVQSGA